METNRRFFLKTGAVSVAIAGIGGASWALTRTPNKALEPWQAASKGFGDPRLDALAYAILAPNPHNRQPWKVELVGDTGLDLYCDLDRLLPATDPYNRQIVIGLGCFLELLSMAASANGYAIKLDSFPDGEPQPVLDKRRIAHIEFSPASPKKDPLFDVVLQRRTTKEGYDNTRTLSPVQLNHLTQADGIDGTTDRKRIDELMTIAMKGIEVEFHTAQPYLESVNLMRIGKTEVNAKPDGIDLSGVRIELLKAAGFLNRDALKDMSSQSFQQGYQMYVGNFSDVPSLVWIQSKDNTRKEQLATGRKWVRLNLLATKMGLAVQPISQPLQEYPEMTEHYNAMHSHLGVSTPNCLQMLGRVGYATEIAPAPRWPMEACLIKA